MRLLFMGLFLSVSTTLLAQSNADIENKLVRTFEQIPSYNEDSENASEIEKRNQLFNKLLLKTCLLPGTIKYDFKKLKESGVFICTSPNGMLRVYSWNQETAGSFVLCRNVIQYQANGVIKAISLKEEWDLHSIFHSIYPIIINNKTIYIAIGKSRNNTSTSEEKLAFFSIENGELVKEAGLIRSKSKIADCFAFSMYPGDVHSLGYQIQYDEKKQRIRVPVLLSEETKPQLRIEIFDRKAGGYGELSGKQTYFQFNGHSFVEE